MMGGDQRRCRTRRRWEEVVEWEVMGPQEEVEGDEEEK